eukprot:Platyproteum_vivax@DN8915_c0_g1_i1.p1
MKNEDLAEKLADFVTYEDYLDLFPTTEDKKYLSDKAIARDLIQVRHRETDLVPLEEFLKVKRAGNRESEGETRLRQESRQLTFDLDEYPFLKELFRCEEEVREDNNVILFLKCKSKRGQVVSGYIDLKQRLADEGSFTPYYLHTAKMIPKSTDLSFMNWSLESCNYTNSSTFTVVLDKNSGVKFESRQGTINPNHISEAVKSTAVHTMECEMAIFFEFQV